MKGRLEFPLFSLEAVKQLPSHIDDLSATAVRAVAEEHLFAQNDKDCDIPKALELLRKAAAKGDGSEAENSACWLMNLLVNATEDTLGSTFERVVAETEDDPEQQRVALYYLACVLLKENDESEQEERTSLEEIADLFERSAALGYVPAMAELAYCLDAGQGRERSVAEAKRLYLQCGNYPAALWNLAVIVEEDEDGDASELTYASACAGDPDGFIRYCELLSAKDEVLGAVAWGRCCTCWTLWSSLEPLHDFLFVLDRYEIIQAKVEQDLREDPEMVPLLFEFGRSLHGNVGEHSIFGVTDVEQVCFRKLSYYRRFENYYVAWTTRARQAALCWMLCARRLNLLKDVARVVARQVFEARNQYEGRFWKVEDFAEEEEDEDEDDS